MEGILNGKTILIAEDDRYVREFVTTLLRESGCVVLEAANGNDAINNFYHQKQIDCALIDLKMPVMDGHGFAAYNYENDLIPIVICTGRADSDTAFNLLRLGVQYYLLKPFDEKQLITTLSYAIGSGNIGGVERSTTSGVNWSIGSIKIPTLRTEVYNACDWVQTKLEPIFNQKDVERLVNFLFEFIFNAFEHGNLSISEKIKSTLLLDGTYEGEITRMEEICTKQISIELSVMRNEVAVKISDEGEGFPFDKYLSMNTADLVRRMEFPNGRGIYMARSYFDEVRYENDGRTVAIKKKLDPSNH